MFTSVEVSIISEDYFKFIMCESDVCEIESQNGDRWVVVKKQTVLPKKQARYTKVFDSTFLLFHRHQNDDGFHFQTEMTTMLDIALYIISHDDYRLKRKDNTPFDAMIEKYASVS